MYSMMTANIGPRDRMVFMRLTDTRAREAYLRISLMGRAAESGITALSWGFVSGLRWWSLRILVKVSVLFKLMLLEQHDIFSHIKWYGSFFSFALEIFGLNLGALGQEPPCNRRIFYRYLHCFVAEIGSSAIAIAPA
eukprot:Plantae.Rhodophyta-Hildenbrandia_rubra.ctg5916.p1 GENE.Plantae.Rhodophyta-Hildenbrandia_rubra.ctg5916~~Plantae.Rhodophyta-Hildenbrandia_rubra.ctg5916.p1  ORF type:complete len:137 (+),score=12.91 Plantae.Rhodophyta-Hildenbrandia_rubra.ctg5916:176-586(+)